MPNDCVENQSIPASSFAAAAASLVLDQSSDLHCIDGESSTGEISEVPLDARRDVDKSEAYRSTLDWCSEVGRCRVQREEKNDGSMEGATEDSCTRIELSRKCGISAENNAVLHPLSACKASSSIHAVTEDNGVSNNSQSCLDRFGDSFVDRDEIEQKILNDSTEGSGELTSLEQNQYASAPQVSLKIHSEITPCLGQEVTSLEAISSNNIDAVTDSDLSISICQQEFKTSEEGEHARDETGHVYDLCPNHPLSPSSCADSSSTFMPSPTTQERHPKSSCTEQSSLLTRGVSLLGKQLTPSRAIFSRNTSSNARANNDMDASSVISDLSQDVKSVKSSVALRTTPSVNQSICEDARKQQHLEESGLILVKRLVEFLSEIPLAPEEETQQVVDGRVKSNGASTLDTGKSNKLRGLTLPASAIGWISHQLDHCNDTTIENLSCDNPSSNEFDCYQVPKQQLECLHNLLRRVTSLRITNDAWPPPLPPTVSEAAAMAKKKTFSSIPETGTISSKLLSTFTDQSSVVNNKSVDEDSGSTTSKDIFVTTFQRYVYELQYNPNVDMKLFPHATNVVVDGIPPSWISHLDTLKNLEMFQMEKGCILDINQLFFPSDSYGLSVGPQNAEEPAPHEDAPALSVYSSLTKLRLSNCALNEAAGLRGRRSTKISGHPNAQSLNSDETINPKRIPTLSRFPNMVSLNLSHNELFRTKTALAGLSSLPCLSSINLSYNRLRNMKDVFMHIGNVKELILSGNEITSSQGLDRLFSLERLSLDQNKIQHLANISGLAKLPFLTNFDLKGNPFELADPESCRVEVFNLFREVRCKSMPQNATYRDMQQLLPILDSALASKEELVAIKNLTFRQAVGPPEVIDNIDAGIADNSEIKVDVSDQSKGRRVTKVSTSRIVHCRIAGSFLNNDVLRGRELLCDRIDDKNLDTKVHVQYKLEEIITSIRPNIVSDQSIGNDTQSYQRSRTQSSFSQGKLEIVPSEKCDTPFPYSLPASLLAEAGVDVWHPVPVSVAMSDFIPSDHENGILTQSDPSVVVFEAESHELFSQLSCDEDVLSADVISGVSNVYFKNMYEDAMNVDETLENVHKTDVSKEAKSIFEGIWEQTYRDNVASFPDATDSTTNTQPKTIDYNTEELNAVYDGPPDYSSICVASDLDLYFDSFVFPRSSTDEDSQEETAYKKKAIITTRIQLFKFDRNALVEWSKNRGDLIERYIGVWREDVLACGSFARSRLSPVKMHKRGFHGENKTQSGKELFVSESRKVVVCLSSLAMYLIADDDVTPKQNTIANVKRAFPSQVPSGATFGDAFWPHALVRHSLDCLVGITIGFQFQRLILRFSVCNASGLSLEYAYVLLTSNKLQTISLLQKLQTHVNDVQSNTGERNVILIENDDKAFLDALGARSDDVVLHYQILNQCWKRGDRAAARRAFVLTDSTIYLLDENYNGDGSNADDDTKRLGDISLAVIDSASLNRVTEVRAANEDPRMITLVILPANKLKRSHKWRLVCNDGEGAERLIDDVRKRIRSKT